MSSPKIARYSLSGQLTRSSRRNLCRATDFFQTELKNTTDDALPNYLNSLKFQQIHFLTDVRLALGYTAVTIAGVLFYADWKLGWNATKDATLWAVITYFTLNSALTIWMWVVERGKVYTGERNGTLVCQHPSPPSFSKICSDSNISNVLIYAISYP